MRLVEPAIYRLLGSQGVTADIHIGVAGGKSSFPLVLIQRISTNTEHTKDGAAQSEEVLIQVTSVSDTSLALANELDDQVTSILNNYPISTVVLSASLSITIKGITKEDNAYTYDEETGTHHIHTDFIVRL